MNNLPWLKLECSIVKVKIHAHLLWQIENNITSWRKKKAKPTLFIDWHCHKLKYCSKMYYFPTWLNKCMMWKVVINKIKNLRKYFSLWYWSSFLQPCFLKTSDWMNYEFDNNYCLVKHNILFILWKKSKIIINIWNTIKKTRRTAKQDEPFLIPSLRVNHC